MMMTDSPVTWAVLAVLAATVFGKWFLHYVNSKQKPAPYQVQKDEDLIFFDQALFLCKLHKGFERLASWRTGPSFGIGKRFKIFRRDRTITL